MMMTPADQQTTTFEERRGDPQDCPAESALITVGLPVRNGGRTIGRALNSLVNQTFREFVVIISDNASTDDTGAICQAYVQRDSRFRYIRQSTNIGMCDNSIAILSAAKTRFFIWLGHDDWLDPDYLQRCIGVLLSRSDLALVCGRARYYSDDEFVGLGAAINLKSDNPRCRLLDFLGRVSDNGTVFGVMRREDLRRIELRPTMARDWMIVASIAFLGKIETLEDVAVHRSREGRSASNKRIAKTLGLSAWHGRLHFLVIPFSIFCDIFYGSDVFAGESRPIRFMLAMGGALLTLRRRLLYVLTGDKLAAVVEMVRPCRRGRRVASLGF
jgi:glycosyltransferase involved in cell wall biosynthesis